MLLEVVHVAQMVRETSEGKQVVVLMGLLFGETRSPGIVSNVRKE